MIKVESMRRWCLQIIDSVTLLLINAQNSASCVLLGIMLAGWILSTEGAYMFPDILIGFDVVGGSGLSLVCGRIVYQGIRSRVGENEGKVYVARREEVMISLSKEMSPFEPTWVEWSDKVEVYIPFRTGGRLAIIFQLGVAGLYALRYIPIDRKGYSRGWFTLQSGYPNDQAPSTRARYIKIGKSTEVR